MKENAEWLDLPMPVVEKPASNTIVAEGNLKKFTGKVGGRPVKFSFPGEMELVVNLNFNGNETLWIAKEKYEMYRYYPSSVPIYSSSDFVISISAIEENTDINPFQNFTDDFNTFELNGTTIKRGSRFYLNEENRPTHCIRFLLPSSNGDYVIDAFQAIGADYEGEFRKVISTFSN